jgi:NADH:ubiquinone oxidoreductase subunit H
VPAGQRVRFLFRQLNLLPVKMVDNLLHLYVCATSAFSEGKFINDLLFLYETALAFSKDTFRYSYTTNHTFIFTTKLATCLVFLSAIRGGVPRYRYDFLTKMGWIKFLGYVISVFLVVFSLLIV